MRRLRRPNVALPVLTIGAGAKTASDHVRARSTEPTVKLSFIPHWTEPEVRGALCAMHGRTCAFCLSGLPRNDPGDVEHFRPKSHYWWLAYSFNNYFLSCSKCNRIFKRNEFPLAEGATRIDHARHAEISLEQRLLIDPVEDSVEDWLIVDEEGTLFHWRLADSVVADSVAHPRVTKTKSIFRWNDDPDLVRDRTDAIDEALLAIEERRFDDARRLASRYRPHGGAVRSLLRSLRIVPRPTEAEELDWWLQDLFREWRIAEQLYATATDSKLTHRRLQELGWTLAVLWKDPPAGTVTEIEAWLHLHGLHAEVQPKFHQLARPSCR